MRIDLFEAFGLDPNIITVLKDTFTDQARGKGNHQKLTHKGAQSTLSITLAEGGYRLNVGAKDVSIIPVYE